MKLGIVTSNGDNHYVGYFRNMGVFGPLSRQFPQVQIIPVNECNWSAYMGCDVVFLLRPSTSQHLDAAKMCSMVGVPLVVDFDDDLINIPPWMENSGWSLFDPAKVREAVGHSDLVTVSTAALEKVLSAGTRTVHLPNAWNEKLFPFMPLHTNRKTIAWRGGGEHREDIEQYLPAMVQVGANNPQMAWMFWGQAPWRIKMIPGKVFKSKWLDLFPYFVSYLESQPWVHIVPLVNHPFNQAKSHNAWLEATAAGALVVAPDFEEWRRPGVFNYSTGVDTVHDFAAKLQAAVECPEREAHQRIQSSRDYILQHLTLRKVNGRRYEAFRRLADGCKKHPMSGKYEQIEQAEVS